MLTYKFNFDFKDNSEVLKTVRAQRRVPYYNFEILITKQDDAMLVAAERYNVDRFSSESRCVYKWHRSSIIPGSHQVFERDEKLERENF